MTAALAKPAARAVQASTVSQVGGMRSAPFGSGCGRRPPGPTPLQPRPGPVVEPGPSSTPECERPGQSVQARSSRPDQVPAAVRTVTASQARTSPAKKSTAATRNRSAPDATARSDVPVTTVPTGKMNDHQARENGRPLRAARTVSATASAPHRSAKPQTGTP